MSNFEKYEEAFVNAFEIEKGVLKGLKYQDTTLWDSIGHMTLIANLEDAFDIMMETEDIIDLSSFEKGMEILEQKYEVNFK